MMELPGLSADLLPKPQLDLKADDSDTLGDAFGWGNLPSPPFQLAGRLVLILLRRY